MKKRTGIIIAIIVILAVIVGACIYGYMSGRNETENTPSETVEGGAQTGQTQEEQPDEPEGGESVQPEQANPSGGESVVVYVPDEQGETLTPVGTDAADDSDQALVDALIAAGSLPAGVEVQSSSTENGVLTLDMNMVYGNAVRSSGTTGENMLIYALVNTFVQARGVDSVIITVDGAPLESGHEVYDYPLQATN